MSDQEEEEEELVSSLGNGKERKKYVLSKKREGWTEEEHEKFQEALQLFSRDWKKIEGHIQTKNVVQVGAAETMPRR